MNQNAPSATQGVTLSNAKITIDAGGIHGTAKAATQFITVNASADVVPGPVGVIGHRGQAPLILIVTQDVLRQGK